LVVIKTKDLNNKLKQTTDLRREDKEKIKKKRRTLKNRGYAAGSRYKRNDEEKTLKKEKQKIEVIFPRFIIILRSLFFRTKSGI